MFWNTMFRGTSGTPEGGTTESGWISHFQIGKLGFCSPKDEVISSFLTFSRLSFISWWFSLNEFRIAVFRGTNRKSEGWTTESGLISHFQIGKLGFCSPKNEVASPIITSSRPSSILWWCSMNKLWIAMFRGTSRMPEDGTTKSRLIFHLQIGKLGFCSPKDEVTSSF